MGLVDLFSEVIASFGFAEAQAEAPAENAPDNDSSSTDAESEEKVGELAEEQVEETSTEDTESQEEEAGGAEEAEGDEGDEEDEEEEAEPEEPDDPKPKLEEDCANSTHCAPVKHHFDECVERVIRRQEDSEHNGPKEDCVEEFFHLQHCATQCAAPKLWRLLK